jgi:formylglycine-generating enzyme required for sulfatase activity
MKMPSRTLRQIGFTSLSLGLCLAVVAASLALPDDWKPGAVPAPEGMLYIPAGSYAPLYASPADTGGTPVAPFFLDAYAVTNADYLAFVEANPSWQRSKAKRLFVDDGYLKNWQGDLDFGPDSMANRPVVNVSWFAAAAYAKWMGKRLPTTAEWELAAAASATRPDGRTDPAYRQHILHWYSERAPSVLPPVGSTFRNYWGAYDLHGLVWEWVLDYNTSLVTGESRNDSDLDLKLFCGTGSVGASNFDDYAAFIRFAFRSGLEAAYTVSNLGFRLAQDAPTRSPSQNTQSNES